MRYTLLSPCQWPVTLVLLRLILGPVLIVNAMTANSWWIVVLAMTGGFLSDVFDGVIARRLGVATPRLRRADSIVDIIFYTCVAIAIRLAWPVEWARWWPTLLCFLSVEVVVQAIHFGRFNRLAAIHAYSAKLWGLILFASATIVLCGLSSRIVVWIVAITGAIAYADALAIVWFSMTIPIDVKGIFSLLRRHQVGAAAAAK